MSQNLNNNLKRKASELTISLPEEEGALQAKLEELETIEECKAILEDVQQARTSTDPAGKSKPFEVELGHQHLAILCVPDVQEQQEFPHPLGLEEEPDPTTDVQARLYKYIHPDPSTRPTETDTNVINCLEQVTNSRTRLIHTGPSVQRLDAILEAQAKLQQITRRSFILCDRINYLVCAQVNKQLGLYAARYALESTFENLRYTFEDALCLDHNRLEVTRHASVRTRSNSNLDLFCFGRVVQITGTLVLIKLFNQDRHIAQRGRDIWLNPESDTAEV